MPSWKSSVRAYKPYLISLYGPQRWFQKATKADFVWDSENRPIPNPKSVKAQNALEYAKSSLPIREAMTKFKPNKNSIRASVVIESNDDGGQTRETVRVVIATPTDLAMLRKFLSITEDWVNDMIEEEGNWVAEGQPARHRFYMFTVLIQDVLDWLASKDIRINLAGSDVYWFVVESDSRGSMGLPVNASMAGPAFNAATGNCVMEVIKTTLTTDELKSKSKEITKLEQKFAHGVWPQDYDTIASALKVRVSITYAPMCGRFESDVKEYGSENAKKTIHIHHWNNHATAIVKGKTTREYQYVSTKQLAKIIDDQCGDIYQTNDCSITLRSEIDGSLTIYQLEESDGVKLDLGKLSPQSQLYPLYTEQFVRFSYNDPNRDAYDSFAKHGIHFSHGGEQMDDIDIDMVGAYSAYMKTPLYRGLPQDITYWYESPTIEEIRVSSGFILTEFHCPIRNTLICQWLSCPLAQFMYDNECVESFLYAALAQTTFDLDTSKFIGNGVGKRVFHKMLGLSTAKISCATFITHDSIEMWNYPTTSKLQLPAEVSDHPALVNHVATRISKPSTQDRYSHVAAAIQDYVALEVYRMFFHIRTVLPDARLITCLVDGLRFSSEGFDLAKVDLGSGWVKKPVKHNKTYPQSDWANAAPTPTIYGPACNRLDCPITVNESFTDMLSTHIDKPSFATLASEGYIHSIQGYAGCGKSYSIRSLLEGVNAVVLTPTHSTRKDMGTHGIRDYLNMKQYYKRKIEALNGDNELLEEYKAKLAEIESSPLQSIEVRTFQSAIQRPDSLRDFECIIIDEAGMLLAQDLNRIVECVGRKPILIVGDPAQHKAITRMPMHAEAKYLVFKDFIEADEKLKALYHDGSDWTRNNMLSKLRYDCQFEAPEQLKDETTEEYVRRSLELRQEHKDEKRAKVEKTAKLLNRLLSYETSADVQAFDTFTAGKVLTEIKRIDDDEDGKRLMDFSMRIRNKEGLKAIYDVCKANPDARINTTGLKGEAKAALFNKYEGATIISSLNKSVNEHNQIALARLPRDETRVKNFEAIMQSKPETDLEHIKAKYMLDFAYGSEILIIARETFTYQGMTIYNGTSGVVSDCMMKFDGIDAEIPLCEIRTPTRATELNPLKENYLWKPKIQLMYAITSYRCQGRTIRDSTVIVDCDVLSHEMLYVAITRCSKMSQLKFAYSDASNKRRTGPYMRTELVQQKETKVIETSSITLPFKITNASQLTIKLDRYRSPIFYSINWSTIDIVAFAEAAAQEDVAFIDLLKQYGIMASVSSRIMINNLLTGEEDVEETVVKATSASPWEGLDDDELDEDDCYDRDWELNRAEEEMDIEFVDTDTDKPISASWLSNWNMDEEEEEEVWARQVSYSPEDDSGDYSVYDEYGERGYEIDEQYESTDIDIEMMMLYG